ncbi:hypothetical protein [Terricaulis silvestris]|uniref:NAD(P)H:quinone oxidoreductase n=1 Tax=Terricaulis silvestris TaxID=2686094 RepID=A0A6I6MKI7_9CAUL|nr:hypothetical protein [Terricaulis silvestris]QGZ93728.1 NAD(P)H:quinone oxidoreductase [Terricaulis silvestris]
MSKVLVLYYSAQGHIETTAHAVAERARERRKIAETANTLHG